MSAVRFAPLHSGACLWCMQSETRTVASVAVRCRLTGAFPVLMAVVIIGGTIGFFVPLATGARLDFWLIFYGLGVVYWWYSVLYELFYEITLYDDETVEFRSMLRTRRVRAQDIEAIVPRWGGIDLYTMSVRTKTGKKLNMIRAMSNMFEFGTRLKQLNPTIDLTRF